MRRPPDGSGSVVEESRRRARQRPRRQLVVRPHGLVRRERVRLRLLQGAASTRAPRACATLGPVLGAVPPGRSRDNVARMQDDLRARRSVVPHVGHRGRDAGRAARAATTRAADTSCCSAARTTAGGTACSPASATRAGSTTSTRSTEMSERTLHVLAHAQRHRVRARESAAGAASESPRARRRARSSTATARPRSTARLTPSGSRKLREVCTRTRHRADLRRGVPRLPPRPRRRAGVLRRARRPRHLRQDARRRPAGRRALRHARAHEALPRRPPDRHAASRAARSTRTRT